MHDGAVPETVGKEAVGHTLVDPPVPQADEMSAPFWVAAAQHRLTFQRCCHCGTFSHPPVDFCASCHRVDEPAFAYEEVSGRGRLVNWTVVHDAMVRGFGPEPWVHALVELEDQEGLLYAATLVDGPDFPLTVGAMVEVVFKDVDAQVGLPQFRLECGATG
jgi:uncharacterized OB-fold protein